VHEALAGFPAEWAALGVQQRARTSIGDEVFGPSGAGGAGAREPRQDPPFSPWLAVWPNLVSRLSAVLDRVVAADLFLAPGTR